MGVAVLENWRDLIANAWNPHGSESAVHGVLNYPHPVPVSELVIIAEPGVPPRKPNMDQTVLIHMLNLTFRADHQDDYVIAFSQTKDIAMGILEKSDGMGFSISE